MKSLLIRSFYCCPDCNYEWEDVWDCACDDSCGECHADDIEPYDWEYVEEYDVANDSRMCLDPEFDKFR